MRKYVHLLVLTLSCALATQASADATAEYSSLEIPKPPFPKPYQNCVVYPQSQSPDHKYGFLYPARSVVFDQDTVDMYLITLKPFAIVEKMPAYDGHLAISSGGFFVANWAKDSSAVVIMYGGRWGPEDVYLVPIQNGKVGKIVDLTAEITKLGEADFKKTKADSFNDKFDFLFDDSDHVTPTNNDDVVRDSGWTINDHNQVIIDCTLASNPKHDPDTKSWVVTVKGLWDIAQGKFASVKLTRTFSGEYKE
jgi:hypothetical protein